MTSQLKLTFSIVCFYALFLVSCKSAIKNDKPTAIDTTKVFEDISFEEPKITENLIINSPNDLLGYWVGMFKADSDSEVEYVDGTDGYSYDAVKKLTFSIDKISTDSVFGHSILGGNIRPFKGILRLEENVFTISVEEPGDDPYDGVFNFSISKNDSILKGEWIANNTTLNINSRTGNLEKRLFEYNPKAEIDYSFIDFLKNRKVLYLEADSSNGVEEDLYDTEFLSTTEVVYEVNPSIEALKKEEVENYSKADIIILRNLIFARHGYVFREKKLRSYFDSFSWYMPVFSDVVDQLTSLEKQNIDLLLRYEENASEYYDTFGR